MRRPELHTLAELAALLAAFALCVGPPLAALILYRGA